MYVFGVGKGINKKKLNDIASHKQNEEHIFILEDLQCLGEAFNQMISNVLLLFVFAASIFCQIHILYIYLFIL